MEADIDPMPLPDQPFYAKSVTELGDTRDIVAAEDIFSAQGLKLIARNSRMDSGLYERLVLHKLRVPLDRCLSIPHPVNQEALAAQSGEIFDKIPELPTLAKALSDRFFLRHVLSEISLNRALAFKLTVAREKFPDLYRHSVLVGLLAAYLGVRAGLPGEELRALSAAGLFHDLGMMHLDPALQDPGRKLTAAERRAIQSHPAIGYALLKPFPEYHPKVSRAVLDHHERLNGSGYPRARTAANIGRLAQILALAEVAASRIGEGGCDCSRLEIMLKLNPRLYSPELVGHLSVLFPISSTPSAQDAPSTPDAAIPGQLDALRQSFEAWHGRMQALRASRNMKPEWERLDGRVTHLQTALRDAGLLADDDAHSLLDGMEAHAAGLAELDALLREAVWHLGDVADEIERIDSAEPACAPMGEWARAVRERLGPSAG
ncbi:MAG: HD domain-containing protein [Betaproteobacteria bacterium]|nr:HD domain-containing protein [Betaproteobacteria bacterium]